VTLERKKKLAFVTTSFPTDFDGQEAAGTFAYDMALSLAKGADVTVIAPAVARVQAGSGRTFPFELAYFPVKSLPLSQLNPLNPFDWWRIGDAIRKGEECTESLARAKGFDHLLCLWALPSGFWGYKMFKKFGIPYSVWVLGSDLWTGSRIPLVRRVLKRVLKSSRACLADGPSLVQAGERLSGRSFLFTPSARKLEVKDTTPPKDKPPYRLAFLGRWHVHKGADLLCEALKGLANEDWKKIERVRFAGGGPLEREVRESLATLQGAGYPVSVEGFKNKEEAMELLKWADYVLIPSRRDSIPVIFSDAMQCRSPVVVNPVGDLPFVVGKFGVGLISESVSARAFAEALARALASCPASFDKGLREAASFFDVEEIGRQVLLATGMSSETVS
jgi:glycosyltransferase involved in cell wall biosynthesis